MTFRILNMAAFATYGELPMASTWVDYCYNEWVSRLPGLNADGGWHNGDSYFQVNLRTLIEVPLSTPVSADSISSLIRGITTMHFTSSTSSLHSQNQPDKAIHMKAK